jgi:hypothetical protein
VRVRKSTTRYLPELFGQVDRVEDGHPAVSRTDEDALIVLFCYGSSGRLQFPTKERIERLNGVRSSVLIDVKGKRKRGQAYGILVQVLLEELGQG